MLKLIFCLRRLPHLSPEEFQDYWLNRHGPLVRSHAQTLRIRRYVQSHTDLTNARLTGAVRASREAPEPFDGVAELWWDDVQSFVAGAATPEGREAARLLLDDERKFIDHARSPLWVAREHVVVGD